MHYTIRHAWFLDALYGCLQLQLYKDNFVLKIDTSPAWFLDASHDCLQRSCIMVESMLGDVLETILE